MTEVRRRKLDRAGRRNSSNSSSSRSNHPLYANQYCKILVLIICSGALYYFYQLNFFSYNNALERSRLPEALIDDIYNETTWGTLRPQLYFGLRTKHPESPLFGLLWYRQPQERMIYDLPIRHWCEHGDNVKFTWIAHDAKNFGRQEITDLDLHTRIDWLNIGRRSWSVRLGGNIANNSSYALVFYMAVQGDSSRLLPQGGDDHLASVISLVGSSMQLGQFTLHFRSKTQLSEGTISHVAYMIPHGMDMRHVNQIVLASLGRPENEELNLVLHQNDKIPPPQQSIGANFAAVQFTVSGIFELQLDFVADGDEPEENFDKLFATKMTEFDQRFDELFPIDYTYDVLQQQPGTDVYKKLAKSALANLLGGIGVWHGHSLIRTEKHSAPKLYGPLSLYSATPSRPFFPRGFLWDEGFHNLLIHQFDPTLSLQIIATWLDAMNIDGWIPREMILGEEAQAKVPDEFLVQSTSVANPPMFFYVLEKFVRNPQLLKRHYEQIARLYPRLKQFYIWLRHTQQGSQLGTMQWQSRNRTTERELNPKILPSGLDDFPRATHPSAEEYHLDLRCWIAFSSRVLRQLAETLGDSDWVPIVERDIHLFNDLNELNRLHWSEKRQQYADYGLHSERVQLVQVLLKNNKADKRGGSKGQGQQQERVFVRKTMEPPKLRLVDDVFGYVNLFPMLLRLLPADSKNLGILLRSLNQTEDLWSPFGLRSLSTKSLYYLARNTEHDPPYWRGAVWVNINYLALDALRHYARSGGPHAVIAAELYEQLRAKLVHNIAEQFARTGYLWEHYNDQTGEGMGTKPFTGWTALLLSILAESYD